MPGCEKSIFQIFPMQEYFFNSFFKNLFHRNSSQGCIEMIRYFLYKCIIFRNILCHLVDNGKNNLLELTVHSTLEFLMKFCVSPSIRIRPSLFQVGYAAGELSLLIKDTFLTAPRRTLRPSFPETRLSKKLAV